MWLKMVNKDSNNKLISKTNKIENKINKHIYNTRIYVETQIGKKPRTRRKNNPLISKEDYKIPLFTLQHT